MAKNYVKQPVVKIPRQIRKWSNLQVPVFEEVEFGKGNLQIDAAAGAGKTATLVESVFRVYTSYKVLCCAFNNKIQKELDSRLPEGVDCFTIHSIGFKAIRNAFGFVTLDTKGDKLYRHIQNYLGDDPEQMDLRSSIAKVVNFAKFNLASTAKEIEELVYEHGIEFDFLNMQEFCNVVLSVMNSTKNERKIIDFADMIWFPNVHKLNCERYDMVFVDETQDLNKAQLEIAIKSCRHGGRIITCGDEFQAIYKFAGADSQSIPNIVKRLGSKRLPLSVTYRCAKKIVECAQQYVPSIQYAENTIDGIVENINNEKMLSMVKPGDFIISRLNAPLISICMALLKRRVPCNINGRNIAENLVSLIKKSKAKDIDSLIDWISVWRDKETERFIKLDKDPSQVSDKAECIIALTEGCNSIKEMISNIDKMFADADEKGDKGIVLLTSVHKIKGNEADRAFVLSSTLRNTNQEELNICYVAVTRPKKELYFVS